MDNQLYNGFKSPNKEYSLAAFWFWNGKLEKNEVKRQIFEMNDKGVYNAFMHARARLITPYLSDEWWNIIGDALEYAKNNDFNLWLYDEYAWPSGTAGSTFTKSLQAPSKVLALGQKNYAKGLKYIIMEPDKYGNINLQTDKEERIISIFQIKTSKDNILETNSIKCLDIHPEYNSYKIDKNCKIMMFYEYSDPHMVDYLNKETIREFINFTHEQYKKRFNSYFGNVIPGIFFDEIYNVGKPLVWTDNFKDEFIKRKSYNLMEYLPLLIFNGDSITKKIRYDYFDVLTSLYEEAFFMQIGNWCEANNIRLTGHTEEHIGSHSLRQGDYFRTQKHLQIPGADCHCFRYTYPRRINPVEAKALSSVCHLYGKKRVMSEALGGAGWAITLEDLKYGANMLFVLGINFMIAHGFHYTLDDQGAMDDWPNSWFYQNPYWRYFKTYADYISRLSYMGTVGHHVCDSTILYPISTMWVNTANGKLNEKGCISANAYEKLIWLLFEKQMDFDVIDEKSIIKSSIVNNSFMVSDEKYKVIVLPPVDILEKDTINKIKEFYDRGGVIIALGFLPDIPEILKMFDTESKTASYTLKQNSNGGRAYFVYEDISIIPDIIEKAVGRDLKVVEGSTNEFYYMHRKNEEQDIYFLVNALNTCRKLTAEINCLGIPRLWNPEEGTYRSIDYFKQKDGKTLVQLYFESNEAYYIVFDEKELKEDKNDNENIIEYNADGKWSFIPISMEVELPQDYSPDVNESKLDIPVMEFNSQYDNQWEQIKVKNRHWQKGFCGRYLSSYKGKWITLRTGWADSGKLKKLYFRKEFQIEDSKILRAQMTMSAVSNGTLYINDVKVAKSNGWKDILDKDVSELLKSGQNVIAVMVENEKTLGSTSDLQRKSYQPEWLTSLLLELNIQYYDGTDSYIHTDSSWIVTPDYFEGWEKTDKDFSSKTFEYKVNDYSNPYRSFNDLWCFAWERGKPPLEPWGQDPLNRNSVEFPCEIKYRQTLPVGTSSIYKPVIGGKYELFIDGVKIEFKDSTYNLDVINKCRELLIKVNVNSFDDGLIEPIKVALKPIETKLIPWQDMGLGWFSGRSLYEKKIKIRKEDLNGSFILNMGDVRFFAEVWVNDKPAGIRLWKPYKLDITNFLHEGENEITILVSNLLANKMKWDIYDEVKGLGWNRYWHGENIERDNQNLVSGMICK